MSNPFDWEHDSASEGLSSLAADLGIDKTANLGELKSRLSVGIDHYGCIHGTVVRGEDSEEREIYLRGNTRQRMIKTLYVLQVVPYSLGVVDIKTEVAF